MVAILKEGGRKRRRAERESLLTHGVRYREREQHGMRGDGLREMGGDREVMGCV